MNDNLFNEFPKPNKRGLITTYHFMMDANENQNVVRNEIKTYLCTFGDYTK